jgi:hypothetical protein
MHLFYFFIFNFPQTPFFLFLWNLPLFFSVSFSYPPPPKWHQPPPPGEGGGDIFQYILRTPYVGVNISIQNPDPPARWFFSQLAIQQNLLLTHPFSLYFNPVCSEFISNFKFPFFFCLFSLFLYIVLFFIFPFLIYFPQMTSADMRFFS